MNKTETYERGWEDGVRKCLELAKSINDIYMVDYLRQLLEDD